VKPNLPSALLGAAPKDAVQIEVDAYQPTSPGQRLAIVAVALATAVILWLLLLYRPGGNPRRYVPSPPAPPALCTKGQMQGCVGGQANVLLLPAASAPAAATGAGRAP
jgi:hypothetical protein